MAQYQPLEKEQLNITTIAVNPAQRGTRHASLAWFWSIDAQGDIDKVDGMAECKWISFMVFHFTNMCNSLPSSLAEGKGPTRSLEGRNQVSLP
jgi:hypothetical protein